MNRTSFFKESAKDKDDQKGHVSESDKIYLQVMH